MKRKTIGGLAVLFALVVTGALGWWLIGGPPTRPPSPTEADPGAVTKYLASEDFGRLTAEQKRDYLSQVRAQADNPPGSARGARQYLRELTDEQRQQLRNNMREVRGAMMQERMDDYFSLPKEERVAYLDTMIDRFQEFGRRRGDRDGGPPRRTRGPRPGDGTSEDTIPKRASSQTDGQQTDEESEESRREHWHDRIQHRIKERIETTDPETRAKMTQFHIELRKRMEERGIQPFHPRHR
ncbi:MAG: hypothetical protein K9N51_00410 [Candidatus Pacebacteria bacterium]|nr:hypothetical protein [Candidatus Paceibacterota bacterium]